VLPSANNESGGGGNRKDSGGELPLRDVGLYTIHWRESCSQRLLFILTGSSLPEGLDQTNRRQDSPSKSADSVGPAISPCPSSRLVGLYFSETTFAQIKIADSLHLSLPRFHFHLVTMQFFFAATLSRMRS